MLETASSAPLRILALEPYYGGSHRAVLDGLTSSVEAQWTLVTLPARKWKWRMRGAAITMAEEATRRLKAGEGWDLIFASTFLNLAEFKGLAGSQISSTPSIVYFHENQLVYPNRHTAEWDFQFPLTNITSALAAERCLFNTEWNLREFLNEIPGFLAQFPDHQPKGVAEKIAAKSAVLAPPFEPSPFDGAIARAESAGDRRGARARVVWPHRWEHDKHPEAFVDAAATLAAEGLDFEVAIAGQEFQDRPDALAEARGVLGDRLVHLGEPKTREEYARLLATSDIAVSTAANEFFGITMIEAAYCGCYPLVPDRLAYPELYPEDMRYSDQRALVARLRALVSKRPPAGLARPLAEHFTFEALSPAYEAVFAEVAARP